MTSSPDDEAGTRYGSSDPGSTGSGATSPYTAPQHDQPQQYGQSSYGQQPAYDQSGYGQQSYSQPQYSQQQYAEQQYAAPQPYGQQSYEQPQYSQPGPAQQYGQYGQQYGQQGATVFGAQAAGGYPGQGAGAGRPGGVVTAAVLGFLLGALGVLATIVLFFLGAVVGGVSSSSDLPQGLRSLGGGITGIVVVVALLALAWTVVMIWGSVWALTGRTRVMLLVGGSIALALTAFSFFGTLADLADSTTSSVVWALVLFLVSLAVVVLLSVPTAGRWFAASRAPRGH